MTNVGKMNQRLSELAALERSLWDAFKDAEKDYLPPAWSPAKSWNEVQSLIKEKRLPWKYHYPAYLLAAFGFAALSVFQSYGWLALYAAAFFAAMHSRKKFVEAYARRALGQSDFETFAFGIEQPSLLVAGMVKLRKVGDSKLTSESVQSILKLLKAGSDYSDVSTGAGEAAKKFLFTVPFISIGWIVGHQADFNKYTVHVQKVAQDSWLIGLFLALMAFCTLLFCYDLLLGQVLLKRRKKKYVLALTMIAESFVKK